MNWYKISQREEFWFIDGQNYFCDGDVCDENHETIVRTHILSNHDLDESSFADIEDEVLAAANFSEEELDVLSKRIDPREYGVKRLGWIKVNGKDIQVYGLDDSKLGQIIKCLWNAYDEEVERYSFNIWDERTSKYFTNIPFEKLERMSSSDLFEYNNHSNYA